MTDAGGELYKVGVVNWKAQPPNLFVLICGMVRRFWSTDRRDLAGA